MSLLVYMSTRLLFCLILILFFALLSSHDNLELAAKCASGEYGYKAMRFDELARGPMPIYYMNEKVRKKRHGHWQNIVLGEEKRYNQSATQPKIDTSATTILHLDKICPPSSINSQNNRSPPSTLMKLQQIRNVLKDWYNVNCQEKSSCEFASIGHRLLHLAIERNETLLTVQVGTSDKSSDPMYNMFVQERDKFMYGNEKISTLNNWLPVFIESSLTKYEEMIQTYTNIAKNDSLGCLVPIHATLSYDGMHINNLLRQKNVPLEQIAILQLDIEKYEYIFLESFLKEIPNHLLPPLIRFERKVMRDQGALNTMLRGRGYSIYDSGEDYLAIDSRQLNLD